MDTALFLAGHQGLITGGYVALFIAMFIEGPTATAAGAFAARLGYFNIWAIVLLSLLGNFIPDMIFYALGYFGRMRFVEKYGRYLGITKAHIESIERIYRIHTAKAILISKLVPLLALPGLVAAGVARMPLKKYALWSILVILPTSSIFLLLGYYSGALYVEYASYSQDMLIGIAIAIVIITYGYKKMARKLGEKIEKGTR